MTLHQTVEVSKKVLLGSFLGIGGLIVLFVLFQGVIIIKNMLFPAKIQTPNHAFNTLPALQFPENAAQTALTYKLNTVTGSLPEVPDRINVYQIEQPQPNLLNLNKVKQKATNLGFVNSDGMLLPEIPLGDGIYKWIETGGLQRSFTINTVSFDFTLKSNYLASLTVSAAQNLPDQNKAITIANDFLSNLSIFETDLDLTKTQNPSPDADYTTYPQIFSIQNGMLVPTTSLSKAQVIRVDLYQKDISYSLNTGKPLLTGSIEQLPLTLPILYPHPPYSTMSFWIAAGELNTDVDAANFVHKNIIISDPGTEAIYPIKTPQEAFDELKSGDGYIATYNGTNTTILINKVYLAYYLSDQPQQYLMPIFVFEGDNGFFAYVSAVRKDWVK
ncbi:MAG TPA: hypothetical protein VE090_00625 [Methylomirabilota bacterium]|nr:hypothetical protein [Methylomirabilota bacterium]